MWEVALGIAVALLTIVAFVVTSYVNAIKLGRFVERVEAAGTRIEAMAADIAKIPRIETKIQTLENAVLSQESRHHSEMKELRTAILTRGQNR
jgi:hypothetical protein